MKMKSWAVNREIIIYGKAGVIILGKSETILYLISGKIFENKTK